MRFVLALVLIFVGVNFGLVHSAEALPSTTPTVNTKICQNPNTGEIYRLTASGGCPTGYNFHSFSGPYSRLCVKTVSPYTITVPIPANNTNGEPSCPPASGATVKPILTTAMPVITAPPPGSAPPGGVPPGGTPPQGSQPAGSPPATCDSGFTAKGPLCIPDNPFSGGGIAGSGSIGVLASRVIYILLGFAGIVAVIFLIIGGYTWMTARGNEAQAVSARKTVVNAIIGIIIVVMSYLIIQVVTRLLATGSG